VSISISSDVLLSYLQVKTGQTSANAGSSTTASLKSKAPTAPWSSTATSATATTSSALVAAPTSASDKANQLAEQIISGQTLVNPSSVKLSQTTSSAAANTDYQNLFALYQGLTSLQSLASAAASSSTTTAQLAILQKAFTAGVNQVRTFIANDPFQEFAVSDGTVSTSDTTSVGVQQSSDTYDTGPLVDNSPNEVVAGLQGDISFSLTSENLQNQPTTVSFDLDQMGSTPRTLSNVVSYLNGQLAAAGLKTRFATNLIPGDAAVTTKVNGVTTTLTPATPDQYGLQINGTPNEMLSFSAAATTPSVYITQTSSDPTATSTTSTTATTTTSTSTISASTNTTSSAAATTTSQFIKLDQPTDAGDPTTRGFTDNLPAGSTVTATATASDGSVYVLANVTATNNGQTLQGQQDAALYKYDSAGNLIYTRTLGSADTVDATALAVSADGTQVAVAGSVTGGAIDPTNTSQAGSTTQQSFVQVYDSSGEPLWNSTQDGDDDNQANAVSFGPDNTVYVAGSTTGRLPGASSAGGQDGYVEGFNVTATTDPLTKAVTYTASSAFTQEFGTSGVDRATGVAVSGNSVYVSSVENGDAVVRQYGLTPTTTTKSAMTTDGPGTATSTTVSATLMAKQDLGALTGGNVSGVTVAADGSVLVAGSTHNAALDAGTITNAYSGNGDAFVADLNSDLDPSGAESLAYYNAGGPTTASAIAVSGDTAYITGQIAGPSIYTPSKGYAAALDPTTGQVSWSTTFTGNNGSAAPSSIAVASGGSSALDALGLPQGALQIQNEPSQLLTANGAVQAGDSFYVQTGTGLPQKVTIAADDTYASLAKKIEVASGYNATATTMTINGEQQLQIKPANANASVRIEAGPSGQDALGPLGLKEGLVSQTATAAAPTTLNGQKVTSQIKSHYSVTVPDTLSLSSATSIAAAQQSLSVAVADVQSIYSDMTTAKSGTTGSTGGTVPAYLTAQIANYQLALARLSGSTSGSSTTPTAASAALSLLAG
jgi:hypothetical protein